MVGRREKIRRSYYKLREQVFRKQIAYLDISKQSKEDMDAVREASAKSGVYDDPDFILKADKLRERLAQKIDSELAKNSRMASEVCKTPVKEIEEAEDEEQNEEGDKETDTDSDTSVKSKSSHKSTSKPLTRDVARADSLPSSKKSSRTQKLESTNEYKIQPSPKQSEHVEKRTRSLRSSPKREVNVSETLTESHRTLKTPKQESKSEPKPQSYRQSETIERSRKSGKSSPKRDSDNSETTLDSRRPLRTPKRESVDEFKSRPSPRQPEPSDRFRRSSRHLNVSDYSKPSSETDSVEEKSQNRLEDKSENELPETPDHRKPKTRLKEVNASPGSIDSPARRELRSQNASARSESDNTDESNLFEIKKEELDEKPPITREMDNIKKLNSQFVLSKKMRDKVQSKVYSSRRLKPVINGVHDSTQRRLDSFFKPIPKKTFSSPSNRNNSNNLEMRVSLSRSPVEEVENRSGGSSPSVLRGFRSTRKENTPTPTRRFFKSENLPNGLSYETGASPETRSTRRKIASIDSNSNDRFFENVDNEISIASPTRNSPRSLRSSTHDFDFNKVGTLPRFKSSRKRTDSSRVLGDVFVDVVNSSDGSDAESDVSGPIVRRRRTRRVDTNDESSCDSGHSVSRYPTRSR